jgi:hypothetical protein
VWEAARGRPAHTNCITEPTHTHILPATVSYRKYWQHGPKWRDWENASKPRAQNRSLWPRDKWQWYRKQQTVRWGKPDKREGSGDWGCWQPGPQNPSLEILISKSAPPQRQTRSRLWVVKSHWVKSQTRLSSTELNDSDVGRRVEASLESNWKYQLICCHFIIIIFFVFVLGIFVLSSFSL